MDPSEKATIPKITFTSGRATGGLAANPSATRQHWKPSNFALLEVDLMPNRSETCRDRPFHYIAGRTGAA